MGAGGCHMCVFSEIFEFAKQCMTFSKSNHPDYEVNLSQKAINSQPINQPTTNKPVNQPTN
jgi:hypothetical protein